MKKTLFIGLAIATLTLAGCGNGGSNSKSVGPKPSSSEAPAKTFEVKIDDGNEVKTEQIELGAKITKPADPAAPAGKAFYGWMNVKNGGQIWDFDTAALNKVMGDVELVPCYVDANLNAQVLEAEVCPDLLAFGGVVPS